MDTSDLDEVLISNGIERNFVLADVWKLDVDGGSQSSSEVGWTGSDIPKMFVVRKLANLLNFFCGSAESIKDLNDTSSLLHRNNSKLILLVDPDEESLLDVVEDTSA